MLMIQQQIETMAQNRGIAQKSYAQLLKETELYDDSL